MKDLFKNIGPGTLVAAAFIGPGTVTVCTLAGVQFGYSLLWAMVVSVIATIILQNMAAKVGLVTQKGLSGVIREELKHPLLKLLGILVILSAIVIGNAAYEAGNITGGVLGINTIVPHTVIEVGALSFNYMSFVIGALAFTLLYVGNYRVIEKSLIVLVLLMSFTFVITAVMAGPSFAEIAHGMTSPRITSENVFMVTALIGTTIVPYNLFLHAALVNQKWHGAEDIHKSRKDTLISVLLGGLVSMAIIVGATAIQSKEITSAADLARSLEPLMGEKAKYFLGIGLFAAGITSAITAPLAAGYVASGCLGWGNDLRSKRFRAVWGIILLTGVLFSAFGIRPIVVIQFAQVANGILLPVVVLFLIWIANKRQRMKQYSNNLYNNALAVVILLFSLFLGAKSIAKVLQLL